MVKLDRTEQRIVGVLIEKQLTVPDTYPLSENALVDGCNQKNNRDPVTDLVPFQVAGALMSLQEKGIVAKVDGGGRVAKYRHKLDEVLRVGNPELIVLTELLLRGPQAPGALKPRVARMGYHATPEQIEALLRQLSERLPALVEQQPQAPRERDRRWRHLLGDASDSSAHTATADDDVLPVRTAAPSAATTSVMPLERVPADRAPTEGAVADLLRRVAALEAQVQQLQAALARQTNG
jgi:uncharacterized protein